MLRDVAGDFTAALTRITAPDRLPSPPDAPTGGAAAMPELDWDPTDADPRYLDSEFAPLVPNGYQYVNDAPPPITHPLGIPGLESPLQRWAPNVEFDHPAGGQVPDVQGNGRR